MKSGQQIIEEMTHRIKEQFHPQKIILFGSFARNEGTTESDVDLLIIVKDVKDRRELRNAIHRAISGLGMSKDVFVLTDEEFETWRDIPGTIAYPAYHEGRVLHAA